MCGIFGVISKEGQIPTNVLVRMVNDLFLLSESRGKESAGLAVLAGRAISVYKKPVSASAMIRSREYRSCLQEALRGSVSPNRACLTEPVALIGHSRLVTNGSQENHDNNQPVIKDGVVGIHNGIIVNDLKLWDAFASLERRYQVDTEIILSLLRFFYDQTGVLSIATQRTFQRLEGTASIVTLFQDLNCVLLATNNGSLYVTQDQTKSLIAFASEEFILRQLVGRGYVRGRLRGVVLSQVKPGYGFAIDVNNVCGEFFALDGQNDLNTVLISRRPSRPIQDITPPYPQAGSTLFAVPTLIPDSISQRFSIDREPISALRRCTRCVLPETMPFIEFDEHGVCNYCHSYVPIRHSGQDKLLELVQPHRRQDGRPDCLVAFSGGRDSCFSLHYIKTVMGMNPVAYTYDWGMVTDLARRNQARLCGRLGIEHILISANIREKRANIRKNVLAWLKKPDLGTVPLFMAGDKQNLYYANKLRDQMQVGLVFFGENLLELTHFKSGFCGVRPSFDREFIYTLSLANKIRLAWYYGCHYMTNPAFINSSLWDTLGGFASYYMIPHHNVNLYGYIMWDEEQINSTLINEYDWETATDTHSTWRIGDGTAAFYNYIYYCVAGFSENDTFRSNQIREGMITREEAMAKIDEENQPRFESIQWYCDTIGIDMQDALTRIQAIPKLYAAA